MGLLIGQNKIYSGGKVRDLTTGSVTTPQQRAAEKKQHLAARKAAEKKQRAAVIPTIAEQADAAAKALFTNWRVINADPRHQVISNITRVDEGDAPTWYVYLCAHVEVTDSLRTNLLSATNSTITDERSTPNGKILVVTLNPMEK